jgi:aspartate aminotransferase-like enzyme
LRSFHSREVNFQPGPVAVDPEVRRAFEQAPESHRAYAFKEDFDAARQSLCELVRARHVELFLGSGTLANDIIGGQLALEAKRGIVLSNGEFGGRLVDHARRWRLDFEALEFAWGSPLDLDLVKKALEAEPTLAWVWCAHCETSTGVVNDLRALKPLCAEFQVNLCLDCISSIGTMPVDLTGVFLASCASGKGLRAYPGVSMAFHHHSVEPQPQHLPRYLDLGYYAQQGVPFTFSSNLVRALLAAVKHVDWEKRFEDVANLSEFLRDQLHELGFQIVGSAGELSPAVLTIALPPAVNSVNIGCQIQEAGYLLHYNTEYLRKRNWIQIGLMGESSRAEVLSLLGVMKGLCFGQARQLAAK